MAKIIEIPLPEENPLDVIVDSTAIVKTSRGRKKKTTEEAPVADGVTE